MSQTPTISREDAEEYSVSLAKIGEGWLEQILWAFRQGIPEAMGMSRLEWRQHYYGKLKIGDIDERQDKAKELAAEGMNNSEIADALGVSEGTIRNDLRDEPESQDYESEETDDEESQVTAPIDEPESQDYESEETDDEDPAEDEVSAEVEPEEAGPVVQVNEGDEWYTPRWLFDALGVKFQIDVCAPPDRTYSSVPAERHFTIEDDGLAQPWEGTIWCNPPYSKPEPWARRMIHHGDGLLLTHIPMNAGWCVDAWETCDAIRLFQAMEFVRPDGTSQRPGYWLQLAAFGPVATEALARLQPLGAAAFNKRRVASPMWRRA